MRHVSTRKIPIKFFMIEGTTQTRIDIMNLPEHSKKSCTGKIRKKLLQKFQEKKIYRGGRFIFTRIWGKD